MRMRAAAWAGAGLFLASLVYFAWFYLVLLGRPVAVPADRVPAALALNISLFTVFALHHSLFARSGVKALMKRIVPPALERVAYVWLASLLLFALCWLWQPLPGTAWQAPSALGWLLHALQFAGILLTLKSASRIDIWELAGVKPAHSAVSSTRPAQHGATPASSAPSAALAASAPSAASAASAAVAASAPSAASAAPSALEVGGPYRWLRHPIYFGWVLFVFGAPAMTSGRLLFASLSTLYLVVAIPLEERGLRAEFGQAYVDYQRKVRWRLVPGLW